MQTLKDHEIERAHQVTVYVLPTTQVVLAVGLVILGSTTTKTPSTVSASDWNGAANAEMHSVKKAISENSIATRW